MDGSPEELYKAYKEDIAMLCQDNKLTVGIEARVGEENYPSDIVIYASQDNKLLNGFLNFPVSKPVARITSNPEHLKNRNGTMIGLAYDGLSIEILNKEYEGTIRTIESRLLEKYSGNGQNYYSNNTSSGKILVNK